MKDTFYLNISTADTLGIGLFKYSLYPQEKFIITNSTLVHILGHASKNDFKKATWDTLFVNTAEKDLFLQTLRKEGLVKFFETLLKTRDGKIIWVAITASKVKGPEEHEYIEGIIENISAHKNTEESLSIERNFLQSVLDNIPDAIYFKDHLNRIVKVNKFYAQGIGLKTEEVIGKTDFDFFPAEQAKQMFSDDNQVLQTGQPIIGKIEHTLLPNGTWNQVITTKIPIYDQKGKIIGTMGMTRDITAYANLEKERRAMLINALKVLGKALEMRDPYTFSHTRHVANIAERIGKKLQWDEDRLLGMRLAGELHDLGKISIPLDILNKPGNLSNPEYLLIQEHVKKCYDLIKDLPFTFPLAETIYQHHERLDGSGYPRGLDRDDILVEARILAVSDVLEAVTNYRPYRQALGIQKAREELTNGKGSKYDHQIVDIALDLITQNDHQAFWFND